MTTTLTIILPSFVACRIDISAHCAASFLARCGGKVYLSGFYDDNLDTFICSAEKHVFVHALELVPERYPENEREADRLNQELVEECLEDDYYPRSRIETMREKHPENFKGLDLMFDEDETPADVVREALQGNPVF